MSALRTRNKIIAGLIVFFVVLFAASRLERFETRSNEGEQKIQMLTVTAITYSNNRSFAVIKTSNETRMFQEGETVEGVKITKINKDSVEFEEGNKKWTQTVS